MRVVSKVEILLGALAVILIILKFIDIFSVNFAFVASMYLLAILYFPLGFLTLKHPSGSIGWLNFLVGLGLSVVCFGICFKILVQVGANDMLSIGIPILLLSILTTMIFALKESGRRKYFRSLLYRASILLTIGLVLMFIPSTTLVKIYYRDDPERIGVTNRMITNPTEENRKEYFDYIDKHPRK